MDRDLTHENESQGEMDRLTLRFVDPEFEATFRRHHFENNLTAERPSLARRA